MKTFYVILPIFFLMLLLVLGNALYIRALTEELSAKVDGLPRVPTPHTADELGQLLAFWEEREALLGLSVSYSMIDRVTEEALRMQSAARVGDLFGYADARVLLLDALEDVGRPETFSARSIF